MQSRMGMETHEIEENRQSSNKERISSFFRYNTCADDCRLGGGLKLHSNTVPLFEMMRLSSPLTMIRIQRGGHSFNVHHQTEKRPKELASCTTKGAKPLRRFGSGQW